MASIKDKGNGSYLISVSLGRINGKLKLVSTTFKPNTRTASGRAKAASVIQGEVENFAFEFERQVKSGHYSTDSAKHSTFEAYLDTWRENYAEKKLTLHTREDYDLILRLHIVPFIGGFKMGSVTTDHIQEIINRAEKSGKRPATIRKIFVVANSVFSYARKHRVIASNPCDRELIDLPTVTSMSIDVDAREFEQEHIFSVEQTRKFLDFCKKPYTVEVHRGKNTYIQQRSIPLQMQAYYHMAFYLGARRGELCALKWTDIDWIDGTVKISKAVSATKNGQIEKAPKTKHGYRTLIMTASCKEMLRKWYLAAQELSLMLGSQWVGHTGREFDKNYVFIKDTDGSQISVYTPYQSLKNAIAQYNKRVPESEALPDIRLHDARHTSASSQIALGVSIADASRNLGHSDVAITSRIYVHGEEDSARRAKEALEKALG